MKNRHSLLEVGASLFFFGLSMILFPSIFEKSETHHYENPDNIYTGIFCKGSPETVLAHCNVTENHPIKNSLNQ
jgi:hypothetical protein